MKLKVLVHGVDNFVGRRVAAVLTASEWAEPLGVPAGATAALHAALGESQAIAHCIVGSEGTITSAAGALYNALQQRPVAARVVHLGSSSVYGDLTGVVNEQTRVPDALGSYARAQRSAELLAQRHADTVILRAGAEYGPECPAWSGRIARLLQAHRLGDLGPAGDGLCNLTYIDDLAAALVGALRQERLAGEIFNITLDAKPTWNEYFTRFGRALGAVPVRRVSQRRLKIERQLLAPPLKVLELATAAIGLKDLSPPPITSSLLAVCRQELHIESGKAVQQLGLRWTPLAEGLAAAAANYRQ